MQLDTFGNGSSNRKATSCSDWSWATWLLVVHLQRQLGDICAEICRVAIQPEDDLILMYR
jgi:hypothetical protein